MCGLRARLDSSSQHASRAGALLNQAPVSHRIGHVDRPPARSISEVCSVWSGPIGYRYISSFGSSGGSIAANASGVGIDGWIADETGVDTEQLELVTHVLAERIVADLGEHCGSTTEARRGDGDVGGRTADRLRERLRIDEAGTGLIGVEINADAADREELEGGAGGCGHRVSADTDLVLELLELGAAGHQTGELGARDLVLGEVAEAVPAVEQQEAVADRDTRGSGCG